MVSMVSATVAGFQAYYVFAMMIDLFAAYKLATDHRFKRWKRYIMAVVIVPLPFVEWIYLGNLAYMKKSWGMKMFDKARDKLGL